MPESSETLLQRTIAWLIGARWWLLIIGIGLAAASCLPAQHIEFNRSIENMFAPDDPVVAPYRQLRETFGGNEMVLAVYDDPELLSPEGGGIERLAEVSRRLREIPGVKDVLSLDRPLGRDIVHPDNPIAARLRDVFAGYTHSTDGKQAAAVCLLEPDIAGASRHEDSRALAIAGIRRVMESLPGGLPAGNVAGEPVLVIEGFRSLEEDGRLLATWSTLLVGVTIVVCFRSLRWVLIPLAVVQLSLWLTYALLVVAGVRLTLVSGMLSAIITVVGIATVVHLLMAYREARSAGQGTAAALRTAMQAMAAPILWSLVTDAAGFGSLLVSQVGPVRDFGLMTTCGALLVLPCLLLLVPGLALAGSWDSTPRHAWGEGGLGWLLAWSSRGVERYPRRIAGGVLLLVVASLAGVLRLEVETDFTRNFRAGSDLVSSYETIESRFGGAGVLDVLVPAPSTLTWDYLQQVDRLEDRLRREVTVLDEHGQERPALTKVLSAADALQAAAPGDPGKLPLAAARDLLVRAGWEVMRQRLPAFADALYAAEPADLAETAAAAESAAAVPAQATATQRAPPRYWLRIMLRARERQPADQKLRLIERVQTVVDEELGRDEWRTWGVGGKRPEGYVTGYFVLLTHLIASTVRDQWTSFGLASLGVLVSLLMALRCWRRSLVALVPNALPIFLVLGTLGWLDLKLNLGAAMIAAVSMGLSVDSSIHYLLATERRQRSGLTLSEALHVVQQDVGRAVVFSTLALVVGFLVLCRSEFMPTVYFGLLVSLAMLGGLLGNLVLLPLLMRLFIVGERTAAH